LSAAKDAKGYSEPQAKQVEHAGRVIADETLACTPMLLISKPDKIVARDSACHATRVRMRLIVGRLHLVGRLHAVNRGQVLRRT
jgi:hypothetical protein